ncbi:MAG TPA: hypothetical protein VGT78_01060 [Rhizomicrobium sp.]|nr:hypothetical protein [Rhizomicrobium sp.]
MSDAPPIERIYDLTKLSEAGDEIQIKASGDDLTRLAQWAELLRVERFESSVSLRKISPTRFAYDAVLTADIVQACVVTLEPVRSHIARSFARELHYTPKRHAEPEMVLTLAAGDEDAPDEIASTRYDLAGPLLEEFSLSIDPYPRAPGVAFALPVEEEPKPESPFAVLKRLKGEGG